MNKGSNYLLVRIFRALMRNKLGNVALETSIVILPLLLLIGMTLEEVVIIFYQQNLTYATSIAARLIRTGQEATQEAQPGFTGTSLSNFVNNLCSNSVTHIVVKGCYLNSPYLGVYVSYGTPSAPPTPRTAPIYSGSTISGSFYTTGAGAPCNLVLVQVFYGWPIVVPFNRYILKNTDSTYTAAGGTIPLNIMSSSVLFQNEPSSSGGVCTAI